MKKRADQSEGRPPKKGSGVKSTGGVSLPGREKESEGAALLWHMLNPKVRREISDHLSLEELKILEAEFRNYKERNRKERVQVEENLIRLTERGHKSYPLLFSLVLFLIFVAVLVLQYGAHPLMGVSLRISLFTPMILGFLAPLSLYFLPPYRIKNLFRIPKDPASLVVALFSVIGLIWILFFIQNEQKELSLFHAEGINLLVYVLGAATAPLLEEVVFRELVPSLVGRSPHYVGHLFSALLFSLAHLPSGLYMGFLYLIAALFLSVVRVRSGGLLYPLLVHSVSNVVTLLVKL